MLHIIMDYQNLEFRRLSEHDIPQIQEIFKDIGEGQDYIPFVIRNSITL